MGWAGTRGATSLAVHRLVLFVFVALAACSSEPPRKPRVFVLNGLDIPVVVSIDGEGGKAKLELAPRSRATPNVSGMAKVTVTTKDGTLISEHEAQLGKPNGCKRVYNVMGAAAYVHEDVVYGTGFGTPQYRRRAGQISEEECDVSFAFVDPPQKIAVKQHGPAGDNRGWLHLEGDGGWVTAVNTLLDDNGEWASQSRGAAQRIVRAVVTHDPANPALPAIEERLRKLGLAMPTPTPGNLLAQPSRRKRR